MMSHYFLSYSAHLVMKILLQPFLLPAAGKINFHVRPQLNKVTSFITLNMPHLPPFWEKNTTLNRFQTCRSTNIVSGKLTEHYDRNSGENTSDIQGFEVNINSNMALHRLFHSCICTTSVYSASVSISVLQIWQFLAVMTKFRDYYCFWWLWQFLILLFQNTVVSCVVIWQFF